MGMYGLYPIITSPTSILPPQDNSYVYGMVVDTDEQEFTEYRQEGDVQWKCIGIMVALTAKLVMAAPAQSLVGTSLKGAGLVVQPLFHPSAVDFPVADRITADDSMGWELAGVITKRDPKVKDGLYTTAWICSTTFVVKAASLRKLRVNPDMANAKEIGDDGVA